MAKEKAIIVDLDGTLCDLSHRLHYVKGEKKDWPSFLSGVHNDLLNRWCSELIYAMDKRGYKTIFCTGREGTKEIMDKTTTWLTNWLPNLGWCLYHREEGDHRKDAIIKRELYKNFIEPEFNVLFVVDDRQQVVDMWREVGLTCLQCAKGDF